jgi:uncharacterized delta-60 repeat protein
MLVHAFLNNLSRPTHASAVAAFTLLILLFNPALSVRAAAGDLDPTLGGSGRLVLPVINGVNLTGLVKAMVQPDGKILGMGFVRFGSPPGHTYRVGLVRLSPNGALDNTFGNGGTVLPMQLSSTNFACIFNLQTDGKVLLACRGASGVVVYRFLADGSVDTGFGSDGIVATNLNGSFEPGDFAIQPDGRIIIGGAASFNGDYSRFVLVRYQPNGSLDASFGQNGVLIAPPNTNRHDGLRSVRLQPDGKIIATGTALAGVTSFVLFRFHANGMPDASFGTNGEVITPAGYNGGQAALLPDGKIILFGGNAGLPAFYRYNSDGTLDASFGTNGSVTVSLVPDGRAVSFARQPDGKLVLGGYVASFTGEATFLAARLNSNGTRDASFGTNGIVITDFGIPGGSVGNDVTIQPDGKILLVGMNTHDKYSNNPVLARYLSGGAPDFDFDGDGKADVSIFRRQASAEWYWLGSANGESRGLQFGSGADRIVPADYDGDWKTDIAVFRDGDWYRLHSSDGSFVAVHFGQSGDTPVAADYDGDGKADLAVFRAGNWYVLNSRDNSFRAEQFGIASDKPVVGDFDGDEKNDLAVYRAPEGVWYAQRSRDGFFGVQFGIASDKPVAADYDGDGKTDVAVYRPSDGVWYLLRSNLGFTATQFGIAADSPAAADYDGDAKADLAVYRDGNWYILRSQQGFVAAQFGAANDSPIPSAFVP